MLPDYNSIIDTDCAEHASLVERLTSDKDREMKSRLEELERQTAERIETLQQQHSDMIDTLNTGERRQRYRRLIIIICAQFYGL